MISLKDKVALLSCPDVYPGQPDHVDVIETHMSFIFLVGQEAYKFKKPNKFPFLDLTTLPARAENCQSELRLNKRLAPQTYLGLSRLAYSADKGLCLDGDGETVEWLVRMKRLHRPLLLDHKIARNAVSEDEVAQLGAYLGQFYHDGPSEGPDVQLYLDHLLQEQKINRRILTDARFHYEKSALIDVLDEVEYRQIDAFNLIRQRADAGYLREGHGDLRPEHVWLGQPIQIFDALEFDRAMRILDPFDEVNYLGLECQLLGAGWIRQRLLTALEHFMPPPPPKLMAYLGAFRCVLRARICIAHLLDDVPMTPKKWPGATSTYLAQAARELKAGCVSYSD